MPLSIGRLRAPAAPVRPALYRSAAASDAAGEKRRSAPRVRVEHGGELALADRRGEMLVGGPSRPASHSESIQCSARPITSLWIVIASIPAVTASATTASARLASPASSACRKLSRGSGQRRGLGVAGSTRAGRAAISAAARAGGAGPGEHVALALAVAEREEVGELPLGLDPLGDDLDPERPGERQHARRRARRRRTPHRGRRRRSGRA